MWLCNNYNNYVYVVVWWRQLCTFSNLADSWSSSVDSSTSIAIHERKKHKQYIHFDSISYIESESNLLVVGSTVNYTFTSVSQYWNLYTHNKNGEYNYMKMVQVKRLLVIPN